MANYYAEPSDIAAEGYFRNMAAQDAREANAYNRQRIEKQDAVNNRAFQQEQAQQAAEMAIEALAGGADEGQVAGFLTEVGNDIGIPFDANRHMPILRGRAQSQLRGENAAPSNVQEWQYYNQLSSEDQQRYQEMKRGGKIFALGGGGQGYLGAGGEQEVLVQPSDAISREAALARAKGLATGGAAIDVAAQDPRAQADLQRVELENQTRAQEAELAQKQRRIADAQKTSVIDLAKALKSKDLKRAYGSLESKLPTIRQDTADIEADVERLSDLLTLENLGLMKGVLTDRDVQILASAASNIGKFKISEQKAYEELDRIISTLETAFARKESAPAQSSIDDLVKKYGG